MNGRSFTYIASSLELHVSSLRLLFVAQTRNFHLDPLKYELLRIVLTWGTLRKDTTKFYTETFQVASSFVVAVLRTCRESTHVVNKLRRTLFHSRPIARVRSCNFNLLQRRKRGSCINPNKTRPFQLYSGP